MRIKKELWTTGQCLRLTYRSQYLSPVNNGWCQRGFLWCWSRPGSYPILKHACDPFLSSKPATVIFLPFSMMSRQHETCLLMSYSGKRSTTHTTKVGAERNGRSLDSDRCSRSARIQRWANWRWDDPTFSSLGRQVKVKGSHPVWFDLAGGPQPRVRSHGENSPRWMCRGSRLRRRGPRGNLHQGSGSRVTGLQKSETERR